MMENKINNIVKSKTTIVILDYETGIDNTGGFVISKKAGSASATKNSDGSYTITTSGGSSSQGTDADFIVSNIPSDYKGIIYLVEPIQKNYGFGANLNKQKYDISFDSQSINKKFFVGAIEPNNFYLRISSTGGTTTMKVYKILAFK